MDSAPWTCTPLAARVATLRVHTLIYWLSLRQRVKRRDFQYASDLSAIKQRYVHATVTQMPNKLQTYCHWWSFNRLLTTREPAWYIISFVSICLSVCLSDDNLSKALTYEVHICTFDIYPGNTGQVRIWMSSGQGQGYRSKKVENPYSQTLSL